MARLSRRWVAAVGAVAVAAGIAGLGARALLDDEPVAPTPTERRALPPARPAPLVAIRRLDRRVCRASRLLRPVCPTRVAASFYPRRGVYLEPHGRPGERYDRFDLIGLPRRGQPRHLALFASRYGLDDIFTRTPARRLGRAAWGGARGRLVLDRSRPAAGDHLVFRWRSRGVEFAFALAVSKPTRQAVATLRAIVASGTSQPGAGVTRP